jgi:hypothetical protein
MCVHVHIEGTLKVETTTFIMYVLKGIRLLMYMCVLHVKLHVVRSAPCVLRTTFGTC